jgi:hypothetical protein
LELETELEEAPVRFSNRIVAGEESVELGTSVDECGGFSSVSAGKCGILISAKLFSSAKLNELAKVKRQNKRTKRGL